MTSIVAQSQFPRCLAPLLLGATLFAAAGCMPDVVAEEASSNVVIPTTHYLYVAYSGINYLSVFEIDNATGALTDTDQDVGLTYNATQVIAHPTRPYVYVTGEASNVVEGYRIDPDTGTLTQIGQWTHAGEGLRRMTFDTAGNYLQIGNATGSALTFRSKRVDLSTGVLSDFGGSTTSISSAHGSFVATNDRGCLYVGLTETDEIYGIKVNASSGAIDSIDTSPAPTFSATEPTLGTATSSVLYVMGGSSPYALDTFQLSSSDCDMTGPASMAVNDNTGSLLRHPSLPVLYVGTSANTTLTAYGLDSSQVPTGQIGGAWSDVDAMDIVMGPAQNRLYVMSFGMQVISVLGIDPGTGIFTNRVDVGLGDNASSAALKSF